MRRECTNVSQRRVSRSVTRRATEIVPNASPNRSVDAYLWLKHRLRANLTEATQAKLLPTQTLTLSVNKAILALRTHKVKRSPSTRVGRGEAWVMAPHSRPTSRHLFRRLMLSHQKLELRNLSQQKLELMNFHACSGEGGDGRACLHPRRGQEALDRRAGPTRHEGSPGGGP